MLVDVTATLFTAAADGVAPAILLSATDSKRRTLGQYMFNAPEGISRLMLEHRARPGLQFKALFLSGTSTAAAGGLGGMVLRLKQDGIGAVHIVGPQGASSCSSSIKSFISWKHPQVSVSEPPQQQQHHDTAACGHFSVQYCDRHLQVIGFGSEPNSSDSRASSCCSNAWQCPVWLAASARVWTAESATAATADATAAAAAAAEAATAEDTNTTHNGVGAEKCRGGSSRSSSEAQKGGEITSEDSDSGVVIETYDANSSSGSSSSDSGSDSGTESSSSGGDSSGSSDAGSTNSSSSSSSSDSESQQSHDQHIQQQPGQLGSSKQQLFSALDQVFASTAAAAAAAGGGGPGSAAGRTAKVWQQAMQAGSTAAAAAAAASAAEGAPNSTGNAAQGANAGIMQTLQLQQQQLSIRKTAEQQKHLSRKKRKLDTASSAECCCAEDESWQATPTAAVAAAALPGAVHGQHGAGNQAGVAQQHQQAQAEGEQQMLGYICHIPPSTKPHSAAAAAAAVPAMAAAGGPGSSDAPVGQLFAVLYCRSQQQLLQLQQHPAVAALCSCSSRVLAVCHVAHADVATSGQYQQWMSQLPGKQVMLESDKGFAPVEQQQQQQQTSVRHTSMHTQADADTRSGSFDAAAAAKADSSNCSSSTDAGVGFRASARVLARLNLVSPAMFPLPSCLKGQQVMDDEGIIAVIRSAQQQQQEQQQQQQQQQLDPEQKSTDKLKGPTYQQDEPQAEQQQQQQECGSTSSKNAEQVQPAAAVVVAAAAAAAADIGAHHGQLLQQLRWKGLTLQDTAATAAQYEYEWQKWADPNYEEQQQQQLEPLCVKQLQLELLTARPKLQQLLPGLRKDHPVITRQQQQQQQQPSSSDPGLNSIVCGPPVVSNKTAAQALRAKLAHRDQQQQQQQQQHGVPVGGKLVPCEGATPSAAAAAALEQLHDGPDADVAGDESIPSMLTQPWAADTSVIFLGTGSAEPSKYRGPSAVLLKLSVDQSHSSGSSSTSHPPGVASTSTIFTAAGKWVLLDAGEGTLGAVRRHMGTAAAAAAVIANLGLIWISHKHADHMLGVPALLEARSALIKQQQQQHNVQGIGFASFQGTAGSSRSRGIGDSSSSSSSRFSSTLLLVGPSELLTWLQQLPGHSNWQNTYHFVPLSAFSGTSQPVHTAEAVQIHAAVHAVHGGHAVQHKVHAVSAGLQKQRGQTRVPPPRPPADPPPQQQQQQWYQQQQLATQQQHAFMWQQQQHQQHMLMQQHHMLTQHQQHMSLVQQQRQMQCMQMQQWGMQQQQQCLNGGQYVYAFNGMLQQHAAGQSDSRQHDSTISNSSQQKLVAHPHQQRHHHHQQQQQKSSLDPVVQAVMCEYLGLKGWQSVAVQHCAGAHGLVLTHKQGWKLVYSGDTRPCAALVTAGSGATLLIHEATFESELSHHARAKRHSTLDEALQVAKDMGAYRTVLTHFSQRYPRLPGGYPADAKPWSARPLLAVDGAVINFALLPVLPAVMPAVAAALEDLEED